MYWNYHVASLLIKDSERQCSGSQFFKKNELSASGVSNTEIYILAKWCELVINLSFRALGIPTEVND